MGVFLLHTRIKRQNARIIWTIRTPRSPEGRFDSTGLYYLLHFASYYPCTTVVYLHHQKGHGRSRGRGGSDNGANSYKLMN